MRGFKKVFLIISVSYLILAFNGDLLAHEPYTSSIPSTFIGSSSVWIGKDPVSAADGEYLFALPLLSLRGLMNLQFVLRYRSQYNRFFHYLPARFWWEPFSQGFAGIMINGKEYGGVYLPNGDLVSFQKNASGAWELTDSTVVVGSITFTDNRPPVKFEMRETANYLYLMDPVKCAGLSSGKIFYRSKRDAVLPHPPDYGPEWQFP